MSSGGGGCGGRRKTRRGTRRACAHPFPTNRNRRAYRCRMAFTPPPSAQPGRPLNLIIGSLYSRTGPRVRAIPRTQTAAASVGVRIADVSARA